ncbi:sugar nucleotide-binding protein [Candidatus Dojkabacteria bacterium]|nr:sugar nucleotide-binding protein [Candidatus Dojkabacteria bacterium]
MRFLIFGYGYLAHKFLEHIGKDKAVITKADIANISQVKAAVDKYEPTTILNCAGRTGHPNIDWCEEHKMETLYSNVAGPLILAKVADTYDLKMVHLGSGCVYQGGTEVAYKESDKPDPNKIPSYYSKTKAWAEEMLAYFPILQLRLRMPLDGVPSPRNLIWKITHYEKVIDVPNSITVIPDFINAAIELINREKVGIYNVINPGFIKHSEILDLYKKIVDPDFKYKTFSVEELEEITKAGRSNCILDTAKLKGEGIELPEIHDRLPQVLKEYKENLNSK